MNNRRFLSVLISLSDGWKSSFPDRQQRYEWGPKRFQPKRNKQVGPFKYARTTNSRRASRGRSRPSLADQVQSVSVGTFGPTRCGRSRTRHQPASRFIYSAGASSQ